MNLQSYANLLKKNWSLLLQIASFITMSVGGIITPPSVLKPFIVTSETKGLALFSVAVFAVIFLYFAKKWKNRKHSKGWLLTTIVFLILSVGCIFYFQYLKLNYVCDYYGQMITMGTVYTYQGNKHATENQNITCETRLDDFVGKSDEIWTAHSINLNKYFLTVSYLLSIILLSLCILSAVQLTYCYTRK